MDDNFTTAFLTIEVFGNFNEQLVLKEVKIKKNHAKEIYPLFLLYQGYLKK